MTCITSFNIFVCSLPDSLNRFIKSGIVMASKRSSPATEELAKAINAFGVHLYQTIKETRDGENMFFSPLSISTAMAMTHLGARGDYSQTNRGSFPF